MGVERTLIEPRSPLTREQREHIGVWQRFDQNGKIESRDMTVGNGKPAFLTGNLGSFVPLKFFQDVKAARKTRMHCSIRRGDIR